MGATLEHRRGGKEVPHEAWYRALIAMKNPRRFKPKTQALPVYNPPPPLYHLSIFQANSLGIHPYKDGATLESSWKSNRGVSIFREFPDTCAELQIVADGRLRVLLIFSF